MGKIICKNFYNPIGAFVPGKIAKDSDNKNAWRCSFWCLNKKLIFNSMGNNNYFVVIFIETVFEELLKNNDFWREKNYQFVENLGQKIE